MRTDSLRVNPVRWAPAPLAVAAAIACCMGGPAQAFKIDTGVPDLGVSLDTTLRYNALRRQQATQADLAASPSIDEGNYTFGKGSLVLSRFDMYNELDVSMRNDFGARLSVASWYDGHYPERTRTNPAITTFGSNYQNGQYSDYVKRYYGGPSGEFMDAFLWGNISLGSATLNLKAGRFAFLPGEFLFGNGSSASYSMAPSDGQKSDLSPGASAKETAMPIQQIVGSLQVTPEWAAIAQYTLDFRSSRLSEGGTFFQVNDAVLNGPQYASNPVTPGPTNPPVRRGQPVGGRSGDISLGLKWQPEWAQGDAFGLWVRQFDDKNPSWANQTEITAGGLVNRSAYAQDIRLIGLTYNSVIAGWAFGAEVNFRKNMPLAIASGGNGRITYGLGQDPLLEGPRGDTFHGLVSGVMTLNKNAVFDSGAIVVQVDAMDLRKITKNKSYYAGEESGVAGRCVDNEVLRNCSTRFAASVGAQFSATWQQALPSVDISTPILLLYGLKGNPAASNAGILPEGSYIFRPGVRAEYLVGNYKHQFDLSYTLRDGKKGVLPGATATTYSGLANFRDRNYISFTYTTGF